MDSQIQRDGRLLEIIDPAWRSDELPYNEIEVPAMELPDPEADHGDSSLTLKEIESKWTDLGLASLSSDLTLIL